MRLDNAWEEMAHQHECQSRLETPPMAEARIAQTSPFIVDVEEGKTYWWCSCGQSARQPFCDGSHKGGEFSPVPFKAERTGKAAFCGCKRTAGAPLCDGAHKGL